MRPFLTALLAGYLAIGCASPRVYTYPSLAPAIGCADGKVWRATHDPAKASAPETLVSVTVRVRHALRGIDGAPLRGLCDRPVDREAYWILLDADLDGTLPEAVALHELGHALLGMDFPHSDDPACAMHAPTPSLYPCPVEIERARSIPAGVVFVVTIDCPAPFAAATRRAMASWNAAAERVVLLEEIR